MYMYIETQLFISQAIHVSINSTHTWTRKINSLITWWGVKSDSICHKKTNIYVALSVSLSLSVCVVYITHEFVTWALNGVFYDNYDPKTVQLLNRNRLKDNSIRLICTPSTLFSCLFFTQYSALFTSLVLNSERWRRTLRLLLPTDKHVYTHIHTQRQRQRRETYTHVGPTKLKPKPS